MRVEVARPVVSMDDGRVPTRERTAAPISVIILMSFSSSSPPCHAGAWYVSSSGRAARSAAMRAAPAASFGDPNAAVPAQSTAHADADGGRASVPQRRAG